MTTKERLIELLDNNCGWTEECRAEDLAEHLIANGVTVQEWHPASEPPNAMENPVLGDFCGIVCPVWYHAHSREWETYGGMRETPRQWMKMPKPPKKEEE